MGGKSSKKSTNAPAAPLDILIDGGIVYLTAKATGKLLRFQEDRVDALGEEGESAQFTVHKKEAESGHVVTLQNGEKFLQLGEEQVGADGTGDELSELKVIETKEGCVAFESVKTAGRYISVGEDGSVQPATELGASTNFTPYSAVKKEEPEPAAAEQTEQQETSAENEEGKTEETATEQKEEDGQVQQKEADEQAETSES